MNPLHIEPPIGFEEGHERDENCKLEDTRCGKPHNNGKIEALCYECQVIKLNL